MVRVGIPKNLASESKEIEMPTIGSRHIDVVSYGGDTVTIDVYPTAEETWSFDLAPVEAILFAQRILKAATEAIQA